MRKIACFLLLWSGSAALPAAETWRWVDSGGVVHYSDRPVPGAERVDLGSRVVQPSSPATAPAARPAPGPQSPPAATFIPYTRCELVKPTQDEVFVGVQDVPMAVALEPALQGDHRIQVQVNGRVMDSWPPTALSASMPEAFRGTYTVIVRVLDGQGRVLCSGPPRAFHVRQPSIYSPGRRAPGGG